MAFFRKSKKKRTKADTLRARTESERNQSKWDELERLVSEDSQDSSISPAVTPSASTPLSAAPAMASVAPASATIPDFDADNAWGADDKSFNSDLKIDMPTLKSDIPTESEFADETPPLTDDLSSATEDKRPMQAATAASVAAGAPTLNYTPNLRSEHENTVDALPDNFRADHAGEFIASPPAVDRADRADIGAMRLDVARISADIQSGEELYRRAQQRIENLTGFVERAEIDFSMLNRLEPENRRLKARNRTIEREIDANAQTMQVLRADLDDREQRLAEKTRVYEITLGKLSTAQKSLQEYERALTNSRESSDRNALNSERLQTSLDVERRENEVLRGRLTDVVSDMDTKQNSYIEAKKIADSLAQDCSDYRHQAESAEKEADELRASLSTAQTQNNAMKAELVSLHEDIRTFKSQSEFTIISREDQMAALQQQVDHLTKQLDVKDDIVRNAARDVQELRKIRTAQDLERERLEAEIETQAYQLDQANSELLKSKQDVTDFDRRYKDVATALSVSQARRQVNAPSNNPDIQPQAQPNLSEEAAGSSLEKANDDFDNLTDDEISDRIMDFRLGLRSDIA